MANKKGSREVTLFTYLNSLWSKKRVEPFNRSTCNPYMLSMYLAHERDLIDMVQEMNKIQFSLPTGNERIVYEYYLAKTPRGRRFIKWTKKTKVAKKREKLLEEIQEEFDVSKMEADKILKVMEKV